MHKRLLRFLRTRGIAAHAAEDAVQDVAERLLTRKVPHTDIDDLMRWCMTVARNSAIDQHRRLRRSVPLDCCDDAADGNELVDTVDARMRLDRVLQVLGTMTQDEVRCVISGLDDDIPSEVSSPALRARRHRLRRRLSELVGCFGLLGVAVRALRPRGRASLGLSSAAVASVALVTVVAGGSPFGTGPDHVRLPVAPVTASVPAPHGNVVVHRPLAAVGPHVSAPAPAPLVARPVDKPDSDYRTPDPRGTVDVRGHHRGSADHGVVCVRGLRVVDDFCVLPSGH